MKTIRFSGLFCLLILVGACAAVSRAQTTKPDYTSKVPKYTFPGTLEAQEAALLKNPLLQRMNASRKALAADRYRPIYHYVNPEGNLNDPNGLSYWRGNWHLFYQAYPPEDPRQHWGHAVSTDLVHWRDLPYAIYPNPEKQVYSGSALVEDDRVIAMYHGTGVGNMVAVSSDPLLLNWEKITDGAAVPAVSADGRQLPYSVFDPSIWKKGDYYYSLSAGRVPEGPGNQPIRANFLFRSKDLVNWDYLHEFVESDRFTLIGDDGACPYFWPIGDRYILNFFSHMSGGQYLLGDYDKKNDKFIVTSGGKYNHGAVSPSGVHAPSAAPDGKGGVIVVFNMNAGKRTDGWNQIMTLPRRLTLGDRDELLQEPVDAVETLRYDQRHVDRMELPSGQEIVLNEINGNAMEIFAEFDLQNAQLVELNVLRSQNKEEYTRISFFKEKGFSSGLDYQAGPGTASMPRDLVGLFTNEELPGAVSRNPRESLISIETTNSSTLPDVQFRAPETAPVAIAPGETVKLRVFIDKSVVEVFINGKQCVATRVYPGRDDSIGVSIAAKGGDAQLKALDAWQMKSIYAE